MKWFKPEGESDVEQARLLWDAYSAGTLLFAAPHLLQLEVLNSAARRWRWAPQLISSLAGDLASLRFEFRDPPVRSVAGWTLQGLTAYDACYVALAEELDTAVVTSDELILRLAGKRAQSLQDAARELS